MGSSLWYQGPGGKQWIWPSNLDRLYSSLIQNPDMITWKGRTAQAEMIETLHFDVLGKSVYNIHPWSKLLKKLESHVEVPAGRGILKIGYDWRISLLDSAATLSSALSQAVGSDVSRPPSGEAHPKFLIIAHSMGGLLLRATIGTKRLDPGWLDRIIFIGSPLRGSPEAFRSFYQGVDLPLLEGLYRVARPLNYREFRRIVSNAFAKFPSLAQLFVPETIDYLRYSAFDRSNPLKETTLPTSMIQAAADAHAAFKVSDAILKQAGTTIFKIFTDSGCSTEVEYEVESVLRPSPAYHFKKTDRDPAGDGTVPAFSASYLTTQLSQEQKSPVRKVVHSKMCNNEKVAELIPGML